MSEDPTDPALPSKPPLPEPQAEVLNEIAARHPKVNDQTRDFIACVLFEGMTLQDAERAVGWSAGYGSRVLRKPHVVAYFSDLRDSGLGAVGLLALGKALQLLQNAKSEKVRADLAMDLMNRSGIGESNAPKKVASITLKF